MKICETMKLMVLMMCIRMNMMMNISIEKLLKKLWIEVFIIFFFSSFSFSFIFCWLYYFHFYLFLHFFSFLPKIVGNFLYFYTHVLYFMWYHICKYILGKNTLKEILRLFCQINRLLDNSERKTYLLRSNPWGVSLFVFQYLLNGYIDFQKLYIEIKQIS